jgi:hypothetical protein
VCRLGWGPHEPDMAALLRSSLTATVLDPDEHYNVLASDCFLPLRSLWQSQVVQLRRFGSEGQQMQPVTPGLTWREW